MNRYAIFKMHKGVSIAQRDNYGIYVLLAGEKEPATGQLPLSTHYTAEEAKIKIRLYEQADRLRNVGISQNLDHKKEKH